MTKLTRRNQSSNLNLGAGCHLEMCASALLKVAGVVSYLLPIPEAIIEIIMIMIINIILPRDAIVRKEEVS